MFFFNVLERRGRIVYYLEFTEVGLIDWIIRISSQEKRLNLEIN